jgi:hypothetical protein
VLNRRAVCRCTGERPARRRRNSKPIATQSRVHGKRQIRCGGTARNASGDRTEPASSVTDLGASTLFHHLSIDLFREAFFALKRDAAPGVDGLTWRTYEADLDLKLTDLHSRVHRGANRALPSRRTRLIPEEHPTRTATQNVTRISARGKRALRYAVHCHTLTVRRPSIRRARIILAH